MGGGVCLYRERDANAVTTVNVAIAEAAWQDVATAATAASRGGGGGASRTDCRGRPATMAVLGGDIRHADALCEHRLCRL